MYRKKCPAHRTVVKALVSSAKFLFNCLTFRLIHMHLFYVHAAHLALLLQTGTPNVHRRVRQTLCLWTKLRRRNTAMITIDTCRDCFSICSLHMKSSTSYPRERSVSPSKLFITAPQKLDRRKNFHIIKSTTNCHCANHKFVHRTEALRLGFREI